MSKEKYLRLFADAKEQGHKVVVVTGAGVSTASGLPDFRGKDGLWRGKNPATLASTDALDNNYEEFLEFYTERVSKLKDCKPNKNHEMLGALTNKGYIDLVITQNIDMFHRPYHKDSNLLEIHGALEMGLDPETKKVRPAVVLYGEAVPEYKLIRAYTELSQADIIVAIGTSLTVNPVSTLIANALSTGAKLFIINDEVTVLDRVASRVYRGDITEILEEMIKETLTETLG